MGVGNYDPDGSQSGTVILKLKGGLEDYYIGFNHAVGFNFGTPEARNKVTVVTQGDAGSQTWKQAELDAGDTFILANYLGTGQKVTIKVVELITGNNGYAHVQLYKDKECEGGCCFDSDCVHACATGVCQAGSCVFDSSTCQGGLFPPTDTPTQFPAPSLIFAQSGSMPYYFLGECESGKNYGKTLVDEQ